MTDSGWQYPGQPGPYGGGAAPPPGGVPPTPPPPAPGAPGAPGAWNGIPGSAHDPAAVPWQQPDYSGGGAPPPEKRWPMIALFGAVVLLVVAIIGVAVTSGGDDDDTVTNADDLPTVTTEPDDDPPATEPDDTEPDDTEPDRPSEPTDPGAFVDDEGGFAISMPTSWAFTSLHGDADTAGERMFPDDADKASLVQQAAETLPGAIVFYGVVSDEVGASAFTTNVNVNSTSVPGAEDFTYEQFATEVRAGIETIGATVTSDEPFTLAGADGIRIEFDYDPSLNAAGVQYSAIVDGELWVVNFASGDVAAYAEEFDAIAQSFEILG